MHVSVHVPCECNRCRETVHVYMHHVHEEIQVAYGQKLYQPEYARTQATITRNHIREILEEINDLYATLGRWKDDRKTAWLVRLVPPYDSKDLGYWKAGVLCMHRILIVVTPHHRSTCL